MSSASDHPPILAADVYTEKSLCHLTVVYPDQFIYAILNANELPIVHEALRSDNDTIQSLREIPNFSDRAEFIPLEAIQTLEWYEGDPTVLIVHDDEKSNRVAKLRISVSNTALRDLIIVALQQATGVPFESSTAKESLWRVAKKPLIWGGILAFVFLGQGITGLMEGRDTIEVPIRGRRRVLKQLVVEIYNTIGPVGMCVVGSGIVLFATINIVNNYRRASYKHIAKAQRAL